MYLFVCGGDGSGGVGGEGVLRRKSLLIHEWNEIKLNQKIGQINKMINYKSMFRCNQWCKHRERESECLIET